MAEAANNNRPSFVGTTISSGKTEFAARLSVIDPALAAAVKNGSVQVVDYALYGTRALKGSTTVELFQSSDDKSVGQTNLNKRQLEANTYFLVTGIQILTADSSKETGTDDDCRTAAFAEIGEDNPAKILNGEFELKCGDKVLIPRNSMEMFHTGADAEKPGFFKLDCPKLISPLTDIVPWLYLPTGATVAKTLIKVVLHGVKTNKA